MVRAMLTRTGPVVHRRSPRSTTTNTIPRERGSAACFITPRREASRSAALPWQLQPQTPSTDRQSNINEGAS